MARHRTRPAESHDERPDSGVETADIRMPRLREELRTLGAGEIHIPFLTLGGEASEFDLEAFAYGMSGLAAPDISVLDHAIWEAREFGD